MEKNLTYAQIDKLAQRIIPHLRIHLNQHLPLSLTLDETYRLTAPWLYSFLDLSNKAFLVCTLQSNNSSLYRTRDSTLQIPNYYGFLQWKLLIQQYPELIFDTLYKSINQFLYEVTKIESVQYFTPRYRLPAPPFSLVRKAFFAVNYFLERIYLFFNKSPQIALFQVPLPFRLRTRLLFLHGVFDFLTLFNDCELSSSSCDRSYKNFLDGKLIPSNEYENWLSRYLYYFIPVAFTREITKIASHCESLFNANVIIADSLHMRHELFNFWTILCSRNTGSYNYILPHGGGTSVNFNNEYDRQINGHNPTCVPNVKIFVSNNLHNLPSQKTSNLIALILPPDAYVDARQESCASDYIQYSDNQARIYRLARAIVEYGFSLVLRPYPHGSLLFESLQKQLDRDNIPYSVSRPYAEPFATLLTKTAANVCTYPETCFSEALAVNINTVHFVCRTYKSYYNYNAIHALQDAGMWFDSIEQLKRFLNSLSSSSSLRANARNAWLESINVGTEDQFVKWISLLKR